jgi:hypothetical protein
MTEEEWLACTRAQKMLEFLQGKASDRKLRLFAVGCCRRVSHLMPDERCRLATDVVERFADAMATEQELRAAVNAAFDSADDNSVATGRQPFAVGQAIYFAARTASYAVNTAAHDAAVSAARGLYLAAVAVAGDRDANIAALHAASAAVNQYRGRLLNEIFGNPFRPVTVDPAWLRWRDGAATSMAQRMYDERRFEDLPILADMLEEAGCTNADILNHCRNKGEHVRGCWAVDLILGKK